MIKKTILKLALSMAAAAMICPTASPAHAESSTAFEELEIANEKTDRLARESKSVSQYDKLMASFEKTETGEMVYPDYYGGLYIDGNGDAVVCVVAESTKEKNNVLKSIKATTGSSNLNIKNVKYSYKELEEMMDFLNEYRQTASNSDIAKNWTGHFLSNRDNTIFVELNDTADEQISLFKKEVTDSPMLTFTKSGGPFVNCSSLNPGRFIQNSTRGVGGSMGYRAKLNGKIGFVTAGHVGSSVGDTIKGKSSAIGKVAASQNWGSVDAAFVEITSSHTPTNTLNGTDATLSTSIKNPPEGSTIHKRGATTGYSKGVISSVDASTIADNTLFTNLTLTNLNADSGDSGGIVYFNEKSGSDTKHYTSGILKGTDPQGTYYTKASLINSAFGITRY